METKTSTVAETLKGVTTKNTSNKFSNLVNAIRNESNQKLKEFNKGLEEQTDTSKIKESWYYKELMTAGAKSKSFELSGLKEYLTERKIKEVNTRLERDLNRLNYIGESGEVIEIKISVEWKKSRMWGSNPRATASVHTTKGWFNFESGSIGGCGYDKNSTAVAKVLNQCNALLNMMYEVKNKHAHAKNNEVFGYGAGYGILPSIEGGVGVSCYPAIMDKLGLTFETVASGKTYDAYLIRKKA